jgi:iron complex transport system substrate-binding protein
MHVDDVTAEIVDAALNIHMRIGPGLLESVYAITLAQELRCRGLAVRQQVWVDVDVDGRIHRKAFRIDLLVEEIVVVEVKSVEVLARVHTKQLLTYLRLMDLRVGMLLNFGCGTMKDGLHRVVNGYISSGASRLRVRSRNPDVLE